jgi:hypothetical protein
MCIKCVNEGSIFDKTRFQIFIRETAPYYYSNIPPINSDAIGTIKFSKLGQICKKFSIFGTTINFVTDNKKLSFMEDETVSWALTVRNSGYKFYKFMLDDLKVFTTEEYENEVVNIYAINDDMLLFELQIENFCNVHIYICRSE